MIFIIEVQEIRRSNRMYKFPVKRFTTIKEIKIMLQKHFPFALNSLHLFHPSRSLALPNHVTLYELGIEREGSHLMLSITTNASAPQPMPVLEPLMKMQALDDRCKDILQNVRQGLLLPNQTPGKTDLLDCTGGVYFMKDSNGRICAVFKPHDEEQGMLNNPKGYAGNGKVGLRKYFNPGEGYLREAAAYLLDEQNIASVPATCIVHCEHASFNYPHFSTTPTSYRSLYPKLGSLQQYIKAADTFEDISSSLLSVYEVQKIALFDMRLLNCDRNSANILCVRKPPRVITNAAGTARRESRSGSLTSNGEDVDYDAEIDMDEFMNRASISRNASSKHSSDQYELIPIDHGYCLPPQLCIEDFDWTWFSCPHIEQPLDPRLKQYMKDLNLEASIDNLKKHGIALPEDSLFLFRLTHRLILQGIEEGLTLKEIACLIARTEDGVPSPLEKAIATAEENAQRAVAANHLGPLAGVPISPPRKVVMRSPMTTTNQLFHQTMPATSGLSYENDDETKKKKVLTKKGMSSDPDNHVNTIVNNVLLQPKATTASTTLYPLMNTPDVVSSSSVTTAPTITINNSQSGFPSLPRSYASSPLVTPPARSSSGNFTDSDKQGHHYHHQQQQDFSDFLLKDSYLRPKGQLAFLNTLDANMLPKTATVNTSVMKYPLLHTKTESELSPEKQRLYAHGDYFARHFANPDETNDSAMLTSLKMMREESASTSHDDHESSDSSNSSSQESHHHAQTFLPVQSPDLLGLGTVQPEVEPVEEMPHNFIDEEDEGEGHHSVLMTTSLDTGLRRVSSFSLLEVQTTEPMVFDKPSKLALSRETTNTTTSVSVKETNRQVSGFTSEEDMEDNSGHGSTNEFGDISPYSDLLSSSNPTPLGIPGQASTTMASFSVARKFQTTYGLTRVASFNAFESPALYDVAEQSSRHFNRLKREKRKLSVKSPEFQELRMQFAENLIEKTIARLHPNKSATPSLVTTGTTMKSYV